MGDLSVNLDNASDVLDKVDSLTTQGAEWVEESLPAIVAGEQAATDKLREFVSWLKNFGTGDNPLPAPPTS